MRRDQLTTDLMEKNMLEEATAERKRSLIEQERNDVIEKVAV